MWVRERRPGDARDARVQLRNGSGDAVFLHEGRGKLGKLEVGKSGFVDLDFEVQKATREVKLQLTVSDNEIGEFVTEEITVPIDTALKLRQQAGRHGEHGAGALRQPRRRRPADRRRPDRHRARLARLATERLAPHRIRPRARSATRHAKALRRRQRAAQARQARPWSTPSRRRASNSPTSPARPPREHLVQRHRDRRRAGPRRLRHRLQPRARPVRQRARRSTTRPRKTRRSGASSFQPSVPLEPGNNIIDIYARENDQVTGVERMWVLRTSGLAEARRPRSRCRRAGKLRVEMSAAVIHGWRAERVDSRRLAEIDRWTQAGVSRSRSIQLIWS